MVDILYLRYVPGIFGGKNTGRREVTLRKAFDEERGYFMG